MSFDIAPYQASVGKTVEASDTVSPRLVAEYAATVGPHLAPVGEGEAAPALHWCLAPEAIPEAGLGHEGHAERGDFLPAVPLPRRMWAGGEIETLGPLRLGDSVTRRSVIDAVALKQGRSGPLCFVIVRHDYETELGLAIRERQDIVFRDGQPTKRAPASDAPARAADIRVEVATTEILLFRYSALTFNAHRIHYDHAYTVGEEGYGGLVVHGPLQATLLFNLAAKIAGATPKRFRYRGVSPLALGEGLVLCLARTAEGAACWTEDASGRTCMEAEATWEP